MEVVGKGESLSPQGMSRGFGHQGANPIVHTKAIEHESLCSGRATFSSSYSQEQQLGNGRSSMAQWAMGLVQPFLHLGFCMQTISLGRRGCSSIDAEWKQESVCHGVKMIVTSRGPNLVE